MGIPKYFTLMSLESVSIVQLELYMMHDLHDRAQSKYQNQWMQVDNRTIECRCQIS